MRTDFKSHGDDRDGLSKSRAGWIRDQTRKRIKGEKNPFSKRIQERSDQCSLWIDRAMKRKAGQGASPRF